MQKEYPSINVLVTVGTPGLTDERDAAALSKLDRQLKAVNATPIHVNPTNEIGEIEEFYDKCDAIIIPGGPDIDPDLYGARRHKNTDDNDHGKDHLEQEIIKKALEDRKPIAGICRGEQLMAVTTRGRLQQDLKHHVGVHYPVFTKKDTLARKIFGKVFINPHRHRQAVKNPGEFMVSGSSDTPNINLSVYELLHHGFGKLTKAFRQEKVTEMIEMPTARHPFALGIQTHIEDLYNSKGPTKRARKFFGALVEAGNEYAIKTREAPGKYGHIVFRNNYF